MPLEHAVQRKSKAEENGIADQRLHDVVGERHLSDRRERALQEHQNTRSDEEHDHSDVTQRGEYPSEVISNIW